MGLLQCRSRGAVVSTRKHRDGVGTQAIRCGHLPVSLWQQQPRLCHVGYKELARMTSRLCTLLRALAPRRRHAAGCVAMATALALAVVGYGGPGTREAVAPRTGIQPAPLPAGPAPPYIAHIVFILEENRSFDNLFGRFPGADGVTTATVTVGQNHSTIPLVPEPYYLWHDLGHSNFDALW